MTLAQRFAQIFGIVYLLVGILGFIPVPPILVNPGTIQNLLAPFQPFNGFLIGLFATNAFPKTGLFVSIAALFYAFDLMTTFTGITSVVIVVEQAEPTQLFGSAPTMLYP